MSASGRTGRHHASRPWWRLRPRYVGSFFLWTSGIHVGIVAADPGLYRDFADGALVPGLTAAWASIFVAHAAIAGLVLAAGEAVLALLLLLGSWTWRRVGWIGTISFHAVLMCFGWGFWLWCLPVVALLVLGATADRRPSDGPWSSEPRTVVGSTR
jgi:hypothetical protein